MVIPTGENLAPSKPRSAPSAQAQPVAWIQPWALDLFRDDKSAYSQPVVPERRSPWEVPLYLGGAGQSEPVAPQPLSGKIKGALIRYRNANWGDGPEYKELIALLEADRAALASIPTDGTKDIDHE